MPNGDVVENGVPFVDIRSNYKDTTGEYMKKDANGKTMYDYAKECYDANGNTDDYYFTLHRFWHAGDIMMALGTMHELYPDMPVDDSSDPSEDLKVTPSDVTVEVGKTETLKPNQDGCSFKSADESVATVDEKGVVTGVKAGETTITVSKDGKTAEVKVTVTDSSVTTTTTDSTTTSGSDTTTTTGSSDPSDVLLGDTNLDARVDITDAVLLNKYVSGAVQFTEQQLLNGDCYDQGGELDASDATALLKFLVHTIESLPETANN